MKKFIWVGIFLSLAVSIGISQQIATPSQLRVKIDATGALLATSTAVTNPTYQTVFSNARLRTDSTGALVITDGGGAGFAPANAQYWVGAADGTLSAEKNLGALSTGLVINTSGVPSAYAGTSCTNQFPRSLSASGAATCASVSGSDYANQSAYSFFGNSTGSSAAPSFNTNPSFQAGTGTGSFKGSGVICDTNAGTCSCSTFTDSSVQNQWNVITCTVPASTLAVNGDELRVSVDFNAAANGNTKEFQMFWNGGTCSGNSAAMCSTGTNLWGTGVTTTTNGNSIRAFSRIKRTASGAQNLFSTVSASTAVIGQAATTASVTDTNTIAISFGTRNTSAAATTAQAPTPTMTIQLFKQ